MSHSSPQRETQATTSSSSPHKSNTTGRQTFAQEPLERDDRRLGFALEMSGHFIGEKPVENLIETLPPVDNAETPVVDFSNVPEGRGREEKMYNPFVTVITKSGVTPSFNLLDTSSKKDAVGKIKPDLGLFSTDVEEAIAKSQSLSHMDLFVEIKPHQCQDAFTSSVNDAKTVKKESLLKMTQASIEHRGQQIDYASQIMALQHRTHLYSISIIGHFARIIRWDRAGACVSARFNYQDGSSNWLAEFLFRYANAPPEARGFDLHAQRATKNEREGLAKAVKDHLAKFDYPIHNQRDLRTTCDPSYPAYKINVKDQESRKESAYIICRPFFEVPSLCSRATRGYLALAVETEELVFLKDTWRVDEPGILSEADVYRILRKYEEILPFLPVILASGDAFFKDGQLQCTKTQDYVEGSQWGHQTTWIRKQVRHRVVQKLALPLRMVRTDKELLEAIRNVLTVIKVAYHKAGILHRDISAGNIMLSLVFGGILNDWDHAINANVDREGHSYRTGTWQFMSISILEDPMKAHSIHDDVESVFWVSYYTALHYFQLTSNTKHLGSVRLFDEQETVIQDGNRVFHTGGSMKRGFLSGRRIYKVEFNSTPITKALRLFADVINRYYLSKAAQEAAEVLEPKEGDQAKQPLPTIDAVKLEKVDDLIKIFDDILQDETMDWSTKFTCAVEDQFPRESVLDTHRRLTAADLRGFEAQASLGTQSSGRRLTGDGKSSGMLPPDQVPAHRGSTNRAGSSTGPGTLSGSTMPVPSGSRTTSRSSSKRRISDRGGEAEEEGQAKHGKRVKKERKGKQVARTSSGRYLTRSQDKKKTA